MTTATRPKRAKRVASDSSKALTASRQLRASLVVIEKDGTAEPVCVLDDRHAEVYVNQVNALSHASHIKARALPVEFKITTTLYCVLIKHKGKPTEVAMDYLERHCAERFVSSYNKSADDGKAFMKAMRIVGVGTFLG
jgi:hypothetical protein